MDLEKISQTICQTARKAGEAIMAIYAEPDKIDVQHKSDASPITRADQASNTIICADLEAMTPRFPIISEENKAIPYATRQHFEYCWMVDPLDGTKEFIKRNGEFTVNIALIHHHRPLLSVVYVPETGELFRAIRGQGAFMQNAAGEEQALRAASFRPEDTALKIVCSRSHLNADTQAFVERYTLPELVARGSSLKFTSIARGQAHLYPRLAPTMEWDTAAAELVLEEAGGKVLVHATGQPMQYNKADLLNPYFVAEGVRLS